MSSILVEARKKARTMGDISPARANVAQQAAQMRLQLWLTGQTHQSLLDFGETAQKILLKHAGEDGKLDTVELAMAQAQLMDAWQKAFMDGWLPLMQAARREAASIPFGTLAIMHERYFKPSARKVEEAKASPVFEPQLQALIEAANQLIYGDGLTLSSRIWRVDRDAREGIHRVLMQSIVESRSAWDTAKDLEKFLGANQDCPRWTSTRLYALTKKDIAAGDRRGLKTGEECEGQGVAYKALRLARNEVQAVHHLASDRIMAVQPWVEKERIVLSPAHPVQDICDDVAGGGEGGEGIYPVGQIVLPLHPQCLCYKVSVRQDEAAFIDRLRGWMTGGEDDGLDAYADFVGARRDRRARDLSNISLLEDAVAQALGVWLFGDAGQIGGRIGFTG